MDDSPHNNSWGVWAMHIVSETNRFGKAIDKLDEEIRENSKETIVLHSEIINFNNSYQQIINGISHDIKKVAEKNKNLEDEIDKLKTFKTRTFSVLATINVILVIIGIGAQVYAVL